MRLRPDIADYESIFGIGFLWEGEEENDMMNMEKNVPVIIFTYNRLEHTVKTISALAENVGADETEVFIYSDGWKNDGDKKKVQSVRNYLHSLDGFNEIHIIERETNIGLADNIIDGITSVINKYGKAIVVEDDIVTSKWFLKYMKDALIKYEKTDRVMAVSGYLPPIETEGLPQSFFTEVFECEGGWGTWERCWSKFERNPEKLIRETTKENIHRININNSVNNWQQVRLNDKQVIRTWAIFFHALIVKSNGLVLNNRVYLSANIGKDGTGENSGYEIVPDTRILSDTRVEKFPDKAELSLPAMKYYEDYYRIQKKKYGGRVKRMMYIFRCEGVRGIIKRVYRKLGK